MKIRYNRNGNRTILSYKRKSTAKNTTIINIIILGRGCPDNIINIEDDVNTRSKSIIGFNVKLYTKKINIVNKAEKYIPNVSIGSGSIFNFHINL